jgi:phage FluMu gp28-like protein
MPLAWALEYQPTILLPGKGQIPFDPWPFQQDFMNCRDQLRVINKPRQCGISTTAAVEAAWEFDNVPGAQIVIISKDQDAAINFHKYIRGVLFSVRKNNKKAPKIVKDNERETTNALGNRIVSLAASKESGRSFSATHLFFDELAFIQYAEDIWQAANATLAQTNGKVTAISTPKGRANLFYRIFEAKDHMGFTIFNYAWWDVPTYNPYYDEYIAATTTAEKAIWIEKAKTGKWYRTQRPKYTELSWRQEFEGAFDANVGSVFSTRQLEKMFHRNWLVRKEDETGVCDIWWTSEKDPTHLYACGIDLGRKNDPSVLITYDYTNLPAQVVDFKYIAAGRADWSMIEQVALEHLKFWEPESRHDGTGSGDAVSEGLSGYSEPVIFTKANKQNMIERVQHAADYRQVRIPKIEPLFREHQRYIWEDKDIVQDTVMANALAISAFYQIEDAFVGMDDFDFVGAAT